MNRRLGFTLVELLIAMTIMIILVTLGVVSLRSSQANGRDEKRKADTTVIAQQLETFYDVGSNSLTGGKYPSTANMNTEANIKTTLRDLNPVVLRAPRVNQADPISLIAATSASAQSPTIDQYIYQPLLSNNTLCTTSGAECRKFILYYRLERTSGVQTITSKRQ